MKKGFLARLATVAVVSATIGMNTVSAASGNIVLDTTDKVYTNSEFEVKLNLNDIEGANLNGIQGDFFSYDDTCIEFVSITPYYDMAYNNNKFAYSQIYGIGENTTFINAKFKSKDKVCKTEIGVKNVKVAFEDRTRKSYTEDISKTIEVQKDNKKVISNLFSKKVFTSVFKLFKFGR